MKNLLVFGYGSKAGSWQIRGIELGRRLLATVVNGDLSQTEVGKFDLAIAVKRPRNADLDILRKANIKVVWDIVDAWPQPPGNWWARDLCIPWLVGEKRRINPCAIVVNTNVMEADCARFNLPTLVLPHHHRPDIAIRPARAAITKIGYEGGVHYLGRWQKAVSDAASKRGWVFTTNPPALADLDIVVVFREQNGYAAKNWKSNVKLANAQGAGIPCILNSEAAYLENASGAELWVDKTEMLDEALDALEFPSGERIDRSSILRAHAPTLENMGAKYLTWLESL